MEQSYKKALFSTLLAAVLKSCVRATFGHETLYVVALVPSESVLCSIQFCFYFQKWRETSCTLKDLACIVRSSEVFFGGEGVVVGGGGKVF